MTDHLPSRTNFTQEIYQESSENGVLLIHGFSSTPWQLQSLAKKMNQEGFSVALPLLAGHGTNPDDLEKTKALDWLASVENSLQKLSKKCQRIVIVGASFGGNLAFNLANKYSDSIVGIISIMTPVNFYRERSLYLLTRIASRYIRSFRKKGPAGLALKDDPQFNAVGSYISLPLKSLLEFYRFIKNNTTKDLKTIHQPILIIQTTQDGVIKPKSAITIYKKSASQRKKIIWIRSNLHTLAWPEEHELFDQVYQEIKLFTDSCFNNQK